jgi:membrane AbrB-like protein
LSYAGLAALFVLAGFAGWVFEWIGAPLPWMIGPLLMTALVFMGLALRLSVPTRLRPIGQVVVATQVGIAFTPAALEMLVSMAPVIVGTALATALSSFAVALIMARITGHGLAQSFLCAVPTSPVEAATMAVSAGINPVPVILSQTLRLAAVVLILPFTLDAIAGWPPRAPASVSLDAVDPVQILVLAVIGVAGAMLFRALRVPNPFFLGPMAATAALAATGFGLEAYPPAILALAQVVLGTWLGATFRREIVTSALGLTIASVVSSLLLLALCTLSAFAIAALSGVDWHTMVLGAAPGGVVEMALTAKFLQQNVVLITTFHLVRIFIIMPNIPWMVRLIVRYDRRNPRRDSTE